MLIFGDDLEPIYNRLLFQDVTICGIRRPIPTPNSVKPLNRLAGMRDRRTLKHQKVKQLRSRAGVIVPPELRKAIFLPASWSVGGATAFALGRNSCPCIRCLRTCSRHCPCTSFGPYRRASLLCWYRCRRFSETALTPASLAGRLCVQLGGGSRHETGKRSACQQCFHGTGHNSFLFRLFM